MKRTVESEQYFTPGRLAEQCLELLEAHHRLDSFDLVVEPSAGEGVFYDRLPVGTRVGLDIDPRHPGLVRADFLTWTPPHTSTRTLTIGNPPFGQRAAMAVDFVEHACTYSDVVAFILPRSFNKYTFQNRVRRDFHLVDSLECSEFATPSGVSVEVRAVFQVWEKRSELREMVQLPDTHPDFEMKHAHLSRVSELELARLRREYEFTIPQVGANFSPRPVETVVKGSHWFIKTHTVGVRERFEQLDFSFLDGMNTAHKSLSKRDIVAAYVTAAGDAVGEPVAVEQATLF